MLKLLSGFDPDISMKDKCWFYSHQCASLSTSHWHSHMNKTWKTQSRCSEITFCGTEAKQQTKERHRCEIMELITLKKITKDWKNCGLEVFKAQLWFVCVSTFRPPGLISTSMPSLWGNFESDDSFFLTVEVTQHVFTGLNESVSVSWQSLLCS